MCLGTLVTQRLCSEGTKRFIRVYFVLRGHTETYQRFTMLRGHWYIIALRECSGISAGIPFGRPQVVVDWEKVIWRPSFFPIYTILDDFKCIGKCWSRERWCAHQINKGRIFENVKIWLSSRTKWLLSGTTSVYYAWKVSCMARSTSIRSKNEGLLQCLGGTAEHSHTASTNPYQWLWHTATTKVEAVLEIAPKTSHPSNLEHPSLTPNPGQNALSMANSIGVTKNSKLGPTGPKHSPLKQATPANAREYYGSKVLGVSNRKTKSLSCSPSMEPTDLTQLPDDNNWLNTNTAMPQGPQIPNGESPERPTTPTSTSPPATDTTPCAKHTMTQMQEYTDKVEVNFTDSKTWDIDEAIAAAAECNIDYVKVTECLDNILEDVEDILVNQRSDLSQHLA